MNGKTVVVTGGTSGIGWEVVRLLAAGGADVIFVGRNQEKCRAVLSELSTADCRGSAHAVVADLSTTTGVRSCAADIMRLVDGKLDGLLDTLINNAATVSSWRVTTAEGYELQFAVNHLAPFLLTHELLPVLRKSGNGRIITVGSGSHFGAPMRLDDVMMMSKYSCLRAYRQSKFANVLFTAELRRRLNGEQGVRAYVADPGLVCTDIGLKGTAGLEKLVWQIRKRLRSALPPEVPARCIATMATGDFNPAPDQFYFRNLVATAPDRAALDPELGRQLWSLSERLCGIAAGDG